MSAIPSNLARVPDLLASQTAVRNINSTNVELLRLQSQLSSGQRLTAPSDDPVDASLINVLDRRIDAADQRLRNLDHASSSLATLDQALSDATSLAEEAKSIASSQVGAGSDADTRAAQATVVDSLIQELARVANRRFTDLHVFGGDQPGQAPVESVLDGFRVGGAGEGLTTDLGEGLDLPITVSAQEALSGSRGRVQGDVDLNPSMTTSTSLESLRGNRGQGVSLGSIEIDIDDGGGLNTVQVDLSDASTVGDALDSIESKIRLADPGALNGGFPAGVTVAPGGERFAFDVAAGFSIDIRDAGAGTTAADLGLDGFTYDSANAENPAVDLDPKLTDETTFGQLNPSTAVDFGDIVIKNGGQQGSVSVAPGTTIGEFKAEVENLSLGGRIEIDDEARRLNAVNEVSGLSLAVEEAGAGTMTATTLGLRSFKPSTSLDVFNDGRGVEIADGAVDPNTGAPDPDRNVDFEITLTDGSSFTVDLEPADAQTVQTVLDKINAEAASAGLGGVFSAGLSDGENGIVLTDTAGGGGTISIEQLNGHAAEDLGLLDGEFTGGAPATFAGEDRATRRVDGLFTALIDLRDALRDDDSSGITLAGEEIEKSLDRLATTRAVVGGRAQRTEAATTRQEDSKLLDQTVRSRLKDVDFAEATSRFSLLGLVRQAGLQATAQTQSLTLLNFLR